MTIDNESPSGAWKTEMERMPWKFQQEESVGAALSQLRLRGMSKEADILTQKINAQQAELESRLQVAARTAVDPGDGKMNILGLFPTPVGICDLGRDLTKEEISFITSLNRRPNTFNQTSVDTYVLKEEPMKALQEFFIEKVNDYFNLMYAPKSDLKLQITQSWINYTSKGGSHHKHTHPNSFVSGVFYIKADSEKDRITFYDGETRQITFNRSNFNIYNSDHWWLSVKTGTLLLFPSTFMHSVDVVNHEEERISLSFNTFFKGTLGFDKELTELVL